MQYDKTKFNFERKLNGWFFFFTQNTAYCRPMPSLAVIVIIIIVIITSTTNITFDILFDIWLLHFADADGCKGGVIQWAFDYVTANDGINTDKVYPYVGKASVLGVFIYHACLLVPIIYLLQASYTTYHKVKLIKRLRNRSA